MANKYKLNITAYSKDTFSSSSKGDSFTVRFNPTTIEHQYDIMYDQTQAVGSSGSENKYQFSKPEIISFDLIFENTFIAEDDTKKYNVAKAIEKFKKVIIDFNGSIHRPNYLKLSWGEFSFKGQIKDLSFTYTAYTRDGKPLQATAKVSFIEVLNIKTRLSEENKSSPDLTHIITIKEGDTLPGLCYGIYGDPSYYLAVAEANGINNFRKLKAGDRVILPPLDR